MNNTYLSYLKKKNCCLIVETFCTLKMFDAKTKELGFVLTYLINILTMNPTISYNHQCLHVYTAWITNFEISNLFCELKIFLGFNYHMIG